MSTIWSKYQYFVNQEIIFEDKFGRWNSFTLENGEKSILTVTMYWIPDDSNSRLKISRAQMNKKEKRIKTVATYRTELLANISQYIKERNTTDVIVTGDLNEAINS